MRRLTEMFRAKRRDSLSSAQGFLLLQGIRNEFLLSEIIRQMAGTRWTACVLNEVRTERTAVLESLRHTTRVLSNQVGGG